MAGEYFQTGQLVPLFSDWSIRPQPIVLAYPSRQYLPRKVRVFIDYLVDEVAKLEALNAIEDPVQQIAAFARLLSLETLRPE